MDPLPRAELVKAFANTIDLQDRTDELVDRKRAARWLADHGLLDGPVRLGAADHCDLLALRGGVRDALGVDGSSVEMRRAAEAVLRELPLHAGLGGSAIMPSAALRGARRAMAALSVAWSELAVTGEVARLKRCADDTCGWVFWDVSRNNSRRWCTMRVCGNRSKARAYTARQRGSRLNNSAAPMPAATHC
jgi:predicted RNA-binding Zn ribbon-like protein